MVFILMCAFPVHVIGIPGHVFVGMPIYGMVAGRHTIYAPMGIVPKLPILQPSGSRVCLESVPGRGVNLLHNLPFFGFPLLSKNVAANHHEERSNPLPAARYDPSLT